jgi:hypothetical protein
VFRPRLIQPSLIFCCTAVEPDPMKQSLRVRTEGLRKSEELSIAVFLRFAGQTEQAAWALSREAGAELLLCAASKPPEGDHAQGALVWVLDEDAPAPGDGQPALRRPLQLEAFSALLRKREAQLHGPSDNTFHAPASLPSAQPRRTEPAATAGNLDAYSGFDLEATHRLTRWPGSELLLDQRHRKILASFLVSRHLSAPQLSSLSGIGQHSCIDFLQSLTAAGLLDSRVSGKPSMGATGRLKTIPTTTTSSTAQAGGGLISRLRKRLGLS